MKNIYLVAITIIYFLLIRTFWQTVSADESYVGSRNTLKLGRTEKALSLANKSILKNPQEPRYYYGRAKVLLATTIEVSDTEKENTKRKALYDLQTAQNLNVKNLVTLRNIVPLYYFLASNDLEEKPSVNNLDPNYTDIAKEFYQSIKNYSPTDVGVYSLLAKYEKRLGFSNELNESLENIERLRPDLLDWYLK